MTEIRKVDAQTQAQNVQSTKQERPKAVFEEPSLWEKTKAFCKGFGEYYQDKYEGTQGIGDALRRTKEIYDEGAAGIDECTFDKVKDPIKEWSRGIEAKLDDGDDSHLSMGERLWAGAQGVGDIADKLASTKGVTVTAAAGVAVAGLAAGAVATAAVIGGEAAAATTSAAIGVAANAAGTVGGTVLAGKGAYDIATADTKEQAQKGGTELGSGAIMLGASAATAKQTLAAANKAGLTSVNPEEVSTVGAMAENVKTAGSGIAKGVQKALGIKTEAMTVPVFKQVEIPVDPNRIIEDHINKMTERVNEVRVNLGKNPTQVVDYSPGNFVMQKDGIFCEVTDKLGVNTPYTGVIRSKGASSIQAATYSGSSNVRFDYNNPNGKYFYTSYVNGTPGAEIRTICEEGGLKVSANYVGIKHRVADVYCDAYRGWPIVPSK